MTERIVMIEVEKIVSHPDNPRRHLGDLTELAESIRKSGILQNLTVIPHPTEDGKYMALIGHRRLGAARVAGLTVVPCVIMEGTTRAEQVSIMIAENVQRHDLTLAEEVQSIQLMIDLGESVESIAEKTGLGRSTVYRRRKLADLDKDAFEKGVERGATLADYEKLNEISDPDLRAECLEAIGTRNFEATLNGAKSKERIRREMEALIADVSQWATEVENQPEGTDYLRYVYTTSPESMRKKPDDENPDVKYYFQKDTWGIRVWRTAKNVVQNSAQEEERRKAQALAEKREIRRQQIIELNKRMYELRAEFIKGITHAQAESIQYAVIEMVVKALFYYSDDVSLTRTVCGFMGVELTAEEKEFIDYPFESEEATAFCDELLEDMCKSPSYALKTLMLFAYAIIGDYDKNSNANYFNKYDEDEAKRNSKLYELLSLVDYETSDEEYQWLDGTHPLYNFEDDNV